MSKNISGDTQERELINRILEIEKVVKALQSNQLTIFVVPKVSADPSSPIDGQMWQNTTTDTLKIRIDGVTKTVTLT